MGLSNRFAHYAIATATLLLLAGSAPAQVTRTATFENFAEGQFFRDAFTDPLSGISFHNLTDPSHTFTIDYSSQEFGGSTYLTSGSVVPGPGGSLGGIGFTADLPEPASMVRLDAVSLGGATGVTLQGFDSSGQKVAEASHLPGRTFSLQITSPDYNIVTFRTIADGDGAYDNISYTVIPEPGALGLLAAVPALAIRRRRR